jgi:hypothetical protein
MYGLAKCQCPLDALEVLSYRITGHTEVIAPAF